MTLDIQKFERRSFPLDAVQVTEENMVELAKWCRGSIQYTTPSEAEPERKRYILVDSHQAANFRQNQGFPGDWVTRVGRNFKVYMDNSFNKNFRPPENTRVEHGNVFDNQNNKSDVLGGGTGYSQPGRNVFEQ